MSLVVSLPLAYIRELYIRKHFQAAGSCTAMAVVYKENILPSVLKIVSNYDVIILLPGWLPCGYSFLVFVNKGHCYGCTKDGDVHMKHPNSAGEYLAGHLKVVSPFGHCYVGWSSDSDDEDV